jgi:hypothetical protein
MLVYMVDQITLTGSENKRITGEKKQQVDMFLLLILDYLLLYPA